MGPSSLSYGSLYSGTEVNNKKVLSKWWHRDTCHRLCHNNMTSNAYSLYSGTSSSKVHNGKSIGFILLFRISTKSQQKSQQSLHAQKIAHYCINPLSCNVPWCTRDYMTIFDWLWLGNETPQGIKHMLNTFLDDRVLIWYRTHHVLHLHWIFQNCLLECFGSKLCRLWNGWRCIFSRWWTEEVFAGFAVEVSGRLMKFSGNSNEKEEELLGFERSSNADNLDIMDFASKGDDRRRNSIRKRGNCRWVFVNFLWKLHWRV